MSTERSIQLKLLDSYTETVEMMDDDDDSSNDSDNDEIKSESSSKNEIMNDFDEQLNNKLNHMNSINYPTTNSDNVNKEFILEKYSEELAEEDDERKRFQIELEFVQSLANPNYLNFLAQRGYFRNQTFLNYLKYLKYWTEPEYVKYIMYPQCLALLELLQHEQFLKEIVNAQCSKYIDEQLLLIWLHYKKKRDWIRIDPNRIPQGIDKLFQNSDIMTSTGIIEPAVINDAYAASEFLLNEKF